MEASGFGALLRRHLLAAGLTQESLAERAGVSTRALSGLDDCSDMLGRGGCGREPSGSGVSGCHQSSAASHESNVSGTLGCRWTSTPAARLCISMKLDSDILRP